MLRYSQANLKAKYLLWKTQVADQKVASTRIRCLLPAIALEQRGYQSIVIDKDEFIDSFKNVYAIIFVKSFTKQDYEIAREAEKHHVHIILDLCDNIFIGGYIRGVAKIFKLMAELASVIVTTHQGLADLIYAETQHCRIIVIPDQLEEFEKVSDIPKWKKIFTKRKYQIIRHPMLSSVRNKFNLLIDHKFYIKVIVSIYRKVKEKFCASLQTRILEQPSLNPKMKRVIWFGNHGAPYSKMGMPSLIAIRKDLEEVNKQIPIELLVVSNNREKFEKDISVFPFRTIYKKWDSLNIFSYIKSADVTVIPNPKDEFSIYKSPNRAILSLSLGVPVVMTLTENISDLSQCVKLDNFYQGILTYLRTPRIAKQDLKRADKILKKYSSSEIANLWEQLIKTLIFSPAISQSNHED